MLDKKLVGSKSYYQGHRAEWLGMAYLICKGYWPIAHHVHTPFCEIDLIMRKGDLIVLVEVKLRISIEKAMWALEKGQQERLYNGFVWWHQKYIKTNHLSEFSYRVDLLALAKWHMPLHIKDVLRV